MLFGIEDKRSNLARQATVGNHKSANALSVDSTSISRLYQMVVVTWLSRDLEALTSISVVKCNALSDCSC